MAGPRSGATRGRWASSSLGAAGTVLAAAVAHVAGGEVRPAASVLVLAGVTLTVLAARAPARLRSVRARLLAGALLQPVLHAVFSAAQASDRSSEAAGLLLAHGLAALLGCWWLTRGVHLATSASSSVLALLVRLLSVRVSAPALVSTRASDSTAALRGRDVLVLAPRRGPPTRVHP